MKSSSLVPGIVLALVVASCGGTDEAAGDTTTTTAAVTTTAQATRTGMGQGGMSATMQQRHQAPIPAEYRGLTNPIPADEESLARGAEAYAVCAVCHGDTGQGDGAAGASLDPVPVDIAFTSQRVGDPYLFWRITDGGADFGSAMPAWGDALDDETIWDLINYIQALGEGRTTSAQGMGQGMGMGQGQGNQAAQAVQQEALLAIAVDQGLITQEQADVFAEFHPLVDAAVAEIRGTVSSDVLLDTALAGLVTAGDLTQEQADTFKTVRDAMAAANLLP